MKPLVVIPARKDSKGIPGKNKKLLAGKPLIQYTIEAARAVFNDAEICVSTDDPDIVALAQTLGLPVPFIRPAELATDESGSMEVMLHALDHYRIIGYDADTLVLLQPTSPLRTAAHIRAAMSMYGNNVDMVVSVTPSPYNPYYNLFEENESGYLKLSKQGAFKRRQDCPEVWAYNGAIYIVKVSSFLRTGNFQFDRIVKFPMIEQESLDLDTPLDWKIVTMLLTSDDAVNH